LQVVEIFEERTAENLGNWIDVPPPGNAGLLSTGLPTMLSTASVDIGPAWAALTLRHAWRTPPSLRT
jgi:hypothetical protein